MTELPDKSNVGWDDAGHAREFEDPPDGSVYGAWPVATLPEPHVPSTTRACDRCGQAVWVDVELVELADRCSQILCTECLERDGVA